MGEDPITCKHVIYTCIFTFCILHAHICMHMYASDSSFSHDCVPFAKVLFPNFSGQSAVKVSQALFKEIHLQVGLCVFVVQHS